ncbi:TPA: hypothetical protein ACPJ2O_001519 [Vibrio diabolicus]
MRKEREKIHIDDSILYRWKDYPTKAAVVFVHGLAGNASDTWAEFPKLLMGSSIGQNFDVLSYGYSTSKVKPTSPCIDSLISEFYSFSLSELRDYESIIFISHSLGSVLVNGLLLHNESVGISNRKFLCHLMITPAFLGGASWPKFSPSKTARQLARNSEFLNRKHEEWKSSEVKNQIKSVVIYGTKDAVVPLPTVDLIDFNFNEQRISKDHIGSPKVKDIDSALYRGVIYGIEHYLRFDTRDSRKYFINMILKTNSSDWDYDSNKEEWIFLNDFRFRIIEVSRQEQIHCNFNSNFQDKAAYQCKYAFLYNGISIYEFYLWDLDGGRYLIPAPLYDSNKNRYIEGFNYRLAKLLEAGGMYKDLAQGLNLAKITVKYDLDVIR